MRDKYPIPRTDDLINALAGLRVFTGLDLRLGYWYLEIHPDSINKTAFVT